MIIGDKALSADLNWISNFSNSKKILFVKMDRDIEKSRYTEKQKDRQKSIERETERQRDRETKRKYRQERQRDKETKRQ